MEPTRPVPVKITQEWANAFAQEWVDAWNSHDLPRVLSHYTPDFEMSSPLIARFSGEPSGVLVGRERVAAYWRTALEKLPDLRFELQGVFVGASSIVICCRTNFARLAAEVLFLNQAGLIHQAAAHYQDLST